MIDASLFPRTQTDAIKTIGDSPLLSLEQSVERAQPLRAWTEVQLKTVARVFQEAWDAWVLAWGLEEDGVSVVSTRESLPLDESKAPPMLWERVRWPTSVAGKTSIRWALDATAAMDLAGPSVGRVSTPTGRALASLEKWLFGERASRVEPVSSRESSLGAKIALQAWSDFWQHLGEAMPDQEADTTAQAGIPQGSAWSGAVHVDIPWAQGVLSVLLSGSQVVKLIDHTSTVRPVDGANPALTPLFQALSPQALRIRTEFRSLEMTLGQLRGLQIGDVVQIPHPLETPVQVVILEDYPLCSGWLGRQDGHVAVELAE